MDIQMMSQNTKSSINILGQIFFWHGEIVGRLVVPQSFIHQMLVAPDPLAHDNEKRLQISLHFPCGTKSPQLKTTALHTHTHEHTQRGMYLMSSSMLPLICLIELKHHKDSRRQILLAFLNRWEMYEWVSPVSR